MSDRDPRADRDALRLLTRRPLSVAELREKLAGLGHSPAEIDALCERFAALGYLDDARLAGEFIVARARRLGHGPDRLVRQLCERGVDPEVARRAFEQAVADGDVDPLALLRRRIERLLPEGDCGLDGRNWRRVYNALIRAGFDTESVRRELEPYRDPSDSHES